MPSYPAALATDADLLVALDNASTTLASTITSGATSLAVVSGAAIATNSVVTIGSEMIFLGLVAGTLATGCVRGYNGTTPASHTAGVAVYANVIASHHNLLTAEVKAMQAAVGVALRNVASGYRAESFQFTLTPLQNLTAATPAVVTLSPFPAGLVEGVIDGSADGSPNTHYLRIGGSNPETVLITGVTAGVSVSFTPANNHTSGTWTLSSATGGIQEAIKYVESLANGGSIMLPIGNTTIYQRHWLSGSPAVTLRGHGKWGTLLLLDTSFTSGDVFYCAGAAALIQFHDFLIAGHDAHASGFAIRIKDNTAGKPIVERVEVFDVCNGFHIDNSDYVTLRSANFNQITNTNCTYGIKQTGSSSSSVWESCFIYSPHPNTGTTVAFTWCLDFGIYIESADGLSATNMQVRANTGIAIWTQSGGSIGTTLFSNCIIDNCRTFAVHVDHTGVPALLGNIYFNNCHIIANYAVSAGEGTAWPLVYLGLLGATGAVVFNHCIIAGGQTDGVYAVDATNLILNGCTVADNNVGGTTGVGVQIVRGNRINVVNSQIWDQRGVPLQAYGVKLSGIITNFLMHGCVLSGNVSDSMLNQATMTLSRMANNVGIDTVNAGITAAATITLPVGGNRNINISGTTQIDTINGMIGNGDKATLFCPGGLTISAAGNVAKTLTTAGLTKVTLEWNTTASKWYSN